MLIGILPSAAATETLLNNLAEAEFDLAGISIVMRDLKLRAAIADDAGPLKGVKLSSLAKRLAQLGLTSPAAAPYIEAVAQGQVLVAIANTQQAEAAAQEMLHDHSAQLIKGLP